MSSKERKALASSLHLILPETLKRRKKFLREKTLAVARAAIRVVVVFTKKFFSRNCAAVRSTLVLIRKSEEFRAVIKRFGEDESRGTQFKRTSSSCFPEAYPQIQQGRGEDGRISHHELTTNDALTYLQNVKEMFQDQKEKYDQFLEVMKDFKAQRTDTAGVIERVKELFKGHNSLIIGFSTFLPKGYAITLKEKDGITIKEDEIQTKKTLEFQEAISFVNKIKKRFVHDDTVYKSFLDILNLYKKEKKGITEVFQEVSDLLDDHHDLLEEFVRFLPPTLSTPSTQNGLHKGNPIQRNYERDSYVPSLRDVPVQRQHDKNIAYHRERVYYNDANDDVSLLKNYKDQKNLVESRERGNRDDDNRKAEHDGTAYIKPQHLHDKRNSAFQVEGSELSSDYGKASLKSGFLSGLMNNDSVGVDQDVPRLSKAENRRKDKMQEMPIPRVKDTYREDYLAKSIQELDLSNCQRCTPSYRHLPDDYPIPIASQRSKLGTEVLNDHWVSVTSGSEDYSFKFMRRNQYEEALFKCEDDRFELDVMIETANSTILRIEELLHKISEKSIVVDVPVLIEDHFTAIHLRCIERLYGDHCLDVVDFLRKRFTQSLPVIVIRLKQRKEEWSKTRSGFNNVWAEVYGKNHYNSLDHRSFYFKQQDSKNLSSKSLLSEIKGIREAKRKEGVLHMDTIAGKISKAPTLEFEYSDLDLHGDLHRLLQFSCEEVCSTKEQSDKVVHFWSSFLAPIIGVAPELLNVNGTESIMKYRKQDAKEYFTVADRNNVGNSLDRGTSCIKGSSKGDSPVDKYNSSGLVSGGGNGTCSGFVQSGKEQHAFMVTCKAPEFKGRDASEIKPVISDVPGFIEEESRIDVEVISAPSRLKHESNVEGLTQTPVSDCTPAKGANFSLLGKLRSGTSTVGDNIEANDYHLISDEAFQPEKEEGELSPTSNSENELELWRKPSRDNKSSQYHEIEKECCSQEAVGENDAYAYDVDSGNACNDDKGSGSDSGDDVCSRQEHNEEEIELNDFDSRVEDKAEAARLGGLKLYKRYGVPSTVSERFLVTAKPLAKHVQSCSCGNEGKSARVFFGNDSYYVLFRLHQILYDRLLSAKNNSTDSGTTKSRSAPDCYSRFMEALYNLLDGTYDNEEFEDDCRALLGNQSYMLFTLDKLIYKLIKQMDIKLLQLYGYETSRKNENYADSVYHENARGLLQDEEIFRFEFSSCLSRLSIQLLDGRGEKPEAVAVALDANFAGYLFNVFLSASLGRKEPTSVLLKRNKRTSMEDVKISNRLDCKINCNSFKVSFVLGTEDLSFRRRRKRRDLSAVRSLNQSRAERFHRLFPPSKHP